MREDAAPHDRGAADRRQDAETGTGVDGAGPARDTATARKAEVRGGAMKSGAMHGSAIRSSHGRSSHGRGSDGDGGRGVADGEPPDVIEVVFPAARGAVARHGPAGSPAATAAAARHTRTEHATTRPERDAAAGPGHGRSLLLGASAVAAVGLAAVVAWQLWPSTPGPAQVYVPAPTQAPSLVQLPSPDALSGATAAPSSRPGRADRTAGPPGGPATAVPRTPVAGSPATAPGALAGAPGRPHPSADPSARRPAGPRTLRAGDRGPDVTELQHVLFNQGFTYVAYTGVYDAATVRGVTQAQQDRGLTCDPRGVYGPCTRAALTG